MELNRIVSETAKPTVSYQKAADDTMEWNHNKDKLAEVFGRYNTDGKMMMIWHSERIVVDVASLSQKGEPKPNKAEEENLQQFLTQDEYLEDTDAPETDTSMFAEELLLQEDLEFQLQNVNQYLPNMTAFVQAIRNSKKETLTVLYY